MTPASAESCPTRCVVVSAGRRGRRRARNRHHRPPSRGRRRHPSHLCRGLGDRAAAAAVGIVVVVVRVAVVVIRSRRVAAARCEDVRERDEDGRLGGTHIAARGQWHRGIKTHTLL